MIESGAVTIVEGYGHGNRVIGVHGRHRFLGDINLITGAPPYLSAVVRDDGEVTQVPAERLRELLAEDEELSNVIRGRGIDGRPARPPAPGRGVM